MHELEMTHARGPVGQAMNADTGQFLGLQTENRIFFERTEDIKRFN